MTTTTLPSAPTTGSDVLRAQIDDALSAAAQDDAVDRYASDTPAGRRLLSLAAQARTTAGRLGADSGTPLVSGPGIVVLRELSAAAHLLDVAVGGAAPVRQLLEVA